MVPDVVWSDRLAKFISARHGLVIYGRPSVALRPAS